MHKTDNNQQDIIDNLRSVGATVQDLSAVGNGCPDIMVGIFGKTFLMEIKNPETRNNLTTDQIIWHDKWKGHKSVVRTVDEALTVIGVEV